MSFRFTAPNAALKRKRDDEEAANAVARARLKQIWAPNYQDNIKLKDAPAEIAFLKDQLRLAMSFIYHNDLMSEVNAENLPIQRLLMSRYGTKKASQRLGRRIPERFMAILPEVLDPYGDHDSSTMKTVMAPFMTEIREVSETSDEDCHERDHPLAISYQLMMYLCQYWYTPDAHSEGINQHDKDFDNMLASLIRRRIAAKHHLRDWKAYDCYDRLLSHSKVRDGLGDKGCYAESLALLKPLAEAHAQKVARDQAPPSMEIKEEN
ncbi:hypothetical protein QBC41DRAFT_382247 [Cercophora samala]|uniref:Uncharacterized protein n=1 Tax=Cercophora samala TaxID=330535 RepID=A0AA39Z0V4_9PEZI|nr:hypothetical protein QBC41DRAFT_382247 [Cercophora samala]